jgi:4-aminobutyrate aminotransferase/(S)-3-amino-2-methylpropionate transaminase
MPLSEIPLPSADASGDDPPEIHAPPPGPMSRAARAASSSSSARPSATGVTRARPRAARRCSPIVLASGKGSNLYDVDGNRYVDLIAGFGALLLGHSPSTVLRSLDGRPTASCSASAMSTPPT